MDVPRPTRKRSFWVHIGESPGARGRGCQVIEPGGFQMHGRDRPHLAMTPPFAECTTVPQPRLLPTVPTSARMWLAGMNIACRRFFAAGGKRKTAPWLEPFLLFRHGLGPKSTHKVAPRDPGFSIGKVAPCHHSNIAAGRSSPSPPFPNDKDLPGSTSNCRCPPPVFQAEGPESSRARVGTERLDRPGS